MLTKNKIKFIRSLTQKKERYSHQKFVIEGKKGVEEAVAEGLEIDEIISLHEMDAFENIGVTLIKANKKEMERISSLRTAPGIIAVVNMPKEKKLDLDSGRYIALDGVNDPGNLGSIIRIADWFQFDGVICSHSCVDIYNSKVVQSTMGSIARIPHQYLDLPEVLKQSSLKKYGAVMNGDSLKDFKFNGEGILIMGSESHGISNEVEDLLDHKVTIDKLGSAESLNVSVATGILAQHFIGD